MGAELFHANRRTDGQTLRSQHSQFRNFVSTPNEAVKVLTMHATKAYGAVEL